MKLIVSKVHICLSLRLQHQTYMQQGSLKGLFDSETNYEEGLDLCELFVCHHHKDCLLLELQIQSSVHLKPNGTVAVMFERI